MNSLTSWAICWRIVRGDGVAIGLTGHDRDLVIDGLPYRAAPGMVPSAIERSDGIEAEMMEIAGALTAAAITEADLVAGRWDGPRCGCSRPTGRCPAKRWRCWGRGRSARCR